MLGLAVLEASHDGLAVAIVAAMGLVGASVAQNVRGFGGSRRSLEALEEEQRRQAKQIEDLHDDVRTLMRKGNP